MAVIKIKRPNGEQHTFNLTDNSRDTGGDYIHVKVNGQELFARLGDNWTPLVVTKSNGTRKYVQHEPIGFSTWTWESRDVANYNRWYVYLPKGKYRVLTEGMTKYYHDLTMSESKTVEITVIKISNDDKGDSLGFNIDNQIKKMVRIGNGTNRLIIERTGNL